MKKSKSSSNGQPKPQFLTGSEVIDLSRLCDMHPRLPVDMAVLMVMRASLGLQRNKHTPGITIQLTNNRAALSHVLIWPQTDDKIAVQHDYNRITEDGAEAIALAMAHKNRVWRVVRRMQREEHADWLMEYTDNGVRKLVAFELSGVDKGSIVSRVNEKLGQVAESVYVNYRWVGVVGFEKPEATLQSVEGQIHDS